jgi:hypothetical protein
MSRARLHIFGWGLLAATFLALLLASLGAGEARAGNCATMNFTFTLGSANPNTCNTPTTLDSTGAGIGLLVTDANASAFVIEGDATATTGAGIGLLGQSFSGSTGAQGVHGQLSNVTPGTLSAGVFGSSISTTANGPGVSGSHVQASGTAPGVLGQTNSTAANAAGVYGTITSHADYSGGVRGENFDTLCCGFGVVGFHAGQGIGIGGYAPNGFGVFGWSPNNWAAYFDGAVEVVRDLHVNGTLFKGAGAFRIDNPLDPAHSYLQHSFVESPDMKNIYDGNVTTNGKGYATVTLPTWFQVLNRDFRYQLTSLSGLQEVAVAKEMRNNRFVIQSQKPHSRVSWQVTGVRHDPYANAHRIQVLVPKTGSADGKYEHPELYGQPHSKSIEVAIGPPRRLPKLHAPGLEATSALPKQK